MKLFPTLPSLLTPSFLFISSSSRTDGRNGYHSSNSVPRSSHKQRRSSPSHRHSSPQPNQPQLYTMDRHTYNTFVQDSSRRQIVLVILINTHHHTEAEELLQSFWSIASQYSDHRLKLCYLCYQTHNKWLEGILSECDEIDLSEIKLRASGCLTGQVATVVALLGSRRQFCVFPEIVSVNHNHDDSKSDNVMVAELVGTSVTKDANQHNYRRKLDEQKVVDISSGSSVATVKVLDSSPEEKQDQLQSRTVVDVLGSVLGFTEDSDCESESKQVESIGPNDFRHEGHRTDDGLLDSKAAGANTGITTRTPVRDGSPPRLNAESGNFNGTPRVHKNGSTNNNGKQLKHDPRVDQIRNKFEMWMERFADGSLKRYTVERWPDWRT